MHIDPEDENQEKRESGAHDSEFVDAPWGYDTRGDKHDEWQKKGVNRISKFGLRNPADSAKVRKEKKQMEIAKLAKVFSDVKADIVVDIKDDLDGDGSDHTKKRRHKKKKMSKVTINQYDERGPDLDVNFAMKWKDCEEQSGSDVPGREGSAATLGTLATSVPSEQQNDHQHYEALKTVLTETIKKLHTLELIGCQLREVPPVLREVQHLKVLRLSHNDIKLLTEEWLWPEEGRPLAKEVYQARMAEPENSSCPLGVPYFVKVKDEEQEQEGYKLDGDTLEWNAYIVGYKEEMEEGDWGDVELVLKEWAESDRAGEEAEQEGALARPDNHQSVISSTAKEEEKRYWLVVDDKTGKRLPMSLEHDNILFRVEPQQVESSAMIQDKNTSGESSLPFLEQLFLDWNSIYSVEVSSLSGAMVERLEVLNLSHNELNVLPSDFLKGARRLKYLDLSGNRKIRSIPETVMECERLELLFLTHNSIEELPSIKKQMEAGAPEYKRLQRLRKLFVAYNKLTKLPEDIGECRKLEKLRVMHNKISDMPRSLCKLENKLEEWAFTGNPLRQPIRDGASTVENMKIFLEYWKEMDAAEQEAERTANSKLLQARGSASSVELRFSSEGPGELPRELLEPGPRESEVIEQKQRNSQGEVNVRNLGRFVGNTSLGRRE